MCVCKCVSVCERVREREGKGESIGGNSLLKASFFHHKTVRVHIKCALVCLAWIVRLKVAGPSVGDLVLNMQQAKAGQALRQERRPWLGAGSSIVFGDILKINFGLKIFFLRDQKNIIFDAGRGSGGDTESRKIR